jgi:hypothetical protein
MKLGTYTFTDNPEEFIDIIAQKHSASVDTYTTVAYFSWGMLIDGKEIILEWDYMSKAQFDALDTLYQADTATVFDPQDGKGNTYNVEITNLEGQYFVSPEVTGARDYRKNVKMSLLILSEV